MVKEIQYTSVKRVLDNLLDHPLLRDLTLEQVVRHTVRFIGFWGIGKFYQDKIDNVEIHDFRGLLPCDLISIIQVRDTRTNVALRSMTDTFTPGQLPDMPEKPKHKDLLNNVKPPKELYIPEGHRYKMEPAFKTQGRIIFTSFPEGEVQIAYKSIPVDDDGFPMVIDNENYLAALEAYITMKVFKIKFDTGKISPQVYQSAQQDYALEAKRLQTEFSTPSVSEAESYSRMYQTLIPKMREFDNGFRNAGDREYLRKH